MAKNPWNDYYKLSMWCSRALACIVLPIAVFSCVTGDYRIGAYQFLYFAILLIGSFCAQSQIKNTRLEKGELKEGEEEKSPE